MKDVVKSILLSFIFMAFGWPPHFHINTSHINVIGNSILEEYFWNWVPEIWISSMYVEVTIQSQCSAICLSEVIYMTHTFVVWNCAKLNYTCDVQSSTVHVWAEKWLVALGTSHDTEITGSAAGVLLLLLCRSSTLDTLLTALNTTNCTLH